MAAILPTNSNLADIKNGNRGIENKGWRDLLDIHYEYYDAVDAQRAESGQSSGGHHYRHRKNSKATGNMWPLPRPNTPLGQKALYVETGISFTTIGLNKLVCSQTHPATHFYQYERAWNEMSNFEDYRTVRG